MVTTRMVPAEGDILARILDTTHATDAPELSPRAFRQFDLAQARLPWSPQRRRRVALVAGTHVLASARVHALSAIVDGERIGVCAIGSLHVDPAHGEPAHASDLMRRVLEEARNDGNEMALIFAGPDTPPDADDFSLMPTTDVELHVIESTRRGAPMTMVRAGDESDIPAIVAMGDARRTACRFRLDRDAAFVASVIARTRLLAGLTAPGGRQVDFVVTEEGRSAVAYVVISRVGHAWTIEECGDRDPAGARVGAILQGLIALEPAERRPVIRAWLPPGFLPPQIRVVSTAPSTVLRYRFLQGSRPPLSADDVLYWKNDVLLS